MRRSGHVRKIGRRPSAGRCLRQGAPPSHPPSPAAAASWECITNLALRPCPATCPRCHVRCHKSCHKRGHVRSGAGSTSERAVAKRQSGRAGAEARVCFPLSLSVCLSASLCLTLSVSLSLFLSLFLSLCIIEFSSLLPASLLNFTRPPSFPRDLPSPFPPHYYVQQVL